jgi:hypothetical protein
MTEDEIYEVYLQMMASRREARKLPFEPSRMEFAVRIASLAYSKGYNEGYKSGNTGVFGEPLG